jgi:serine/threonine protein phosphatase 1
MKQFVMGDLHGYYSGLVECLQKAQFDYDMDQLIQLGDVVDGGKQSYECVEELLKIKHLIAIKGNHDAWFLEFLQTGYHPSGWTYGGVETVRSYGTKLDRPPIIRGTGNAYKVSLDPKDIPTSHRRFFEQQILYFIDPMNNCFVHGGFNPTIPFLNQRPETYYWNRELWEAALQWQVDHSLGNVAPFPFSTSFNKIYLGHSSTIIWGIDKPMKAGNIYNLDTGSSKSGRLTIMDVNTHQFWQSTKVD